MFPAKTEYRLATKPSDYRACRKLEKEVGMESEVTMSFPTVLAERDGKLLGFLGTNYSGQRINAGPFAIKTDSKVPVFVLRLVEAYENVVRGTGVSRYYFYIEKRHSNFIRWVRDVFGIEPYHEEEDKLHFVRRF